MTSLLSELDLGMWKLSAPEGKIEAIINVVEIFVCLCLSYNYIPLCSRQLRSGKRGTVLFAYMFLTIIVNLAELLFVTFMSIMLLLPLFNISIIVIVFAVRV